MDIGQIDLVQLAPWIIAAVAVLTLSGKVMGWLGRQSKRLIQWLVKVDHAAQIRDDVEGIRGDVKEIRGQVNEVSVRVTQIFDFFLGKRTIAPGSPVQLTDFGREIAKKLRAEEWAAALAPTLLDKVAGMQPFEIDAYADSYSKKNLSDDMKKSVAACAYEFGTTQDGVKSVLRVVLRDEILRLHDLDNAAGRKTG